MNASPGLICKCKFHFDGWRMFEACRGYSAGALLVLSAPTAIFGIIREKPEEVRTACEEREFFC